MTEAGGIPPSNERSAVLERWLQAVHHGATPTRETWWDDLRQLGQIDLVTARRLTEGEPRWPWIPPFELDQVDELIGRTVEPEGAELLRRAAQEALETPRAEPTATHHPALPKASNAADSPAAPAAQIPPAGFDAPTEDYRHTPVPEIQVALAADRSTRRWLLLTAAILLLAAFFALWMRSSSQAPAVEPVQPNTRLAAELKVSPAPSPERLQLANALLELVEALEASHEPQLHALFLHQVEPLLTLDAEAISHRPEMADAVLSLALRRGGVAIPGWVCEQPLLSAVACGLIGTSSGAPKGELRADCDADPPIDALRGLTAWVWSFETKTGSDRASTAASSGDGESSP